MTTSSSKVENTPPPAQEREASDSSGRSLLVLPRGDDAELRVLRTTFRGRTSIDIRLWWRNRAGEWLPTRKGAAIGLDELPQLRDVLARATAPAEDSR